MVIDERGGGPPPHRERSPAQTSRTTNDVATEERLPRFGQPPPLDSAHYKVQTALKTFEAVQRRATNTTGGGGGGGSGGGSEAMGVTVRTTRSNATGLDQTTDRLLGGTWSSLGGPPDPLLGESYSEMNEAGLRRKLQVSDQIVRRLFLKNQELVRRLRGFEAVYGKNSPASPTHQGNGGAGSSTDGAVPDSLPSLPRPDAPSSPRRSSFGSLPQYGGGTPRSSSQLGKRTQEPRSADLDLVDSLRHQVEQLEGLLAAAHSADCPCRRQTVDRVMNEERETELLRLRQIEHDYETLLLAKVETTRQNAARRDLNSPNHPSSPQKDLARLVETLKRKLTSDSQRHEVELGRKKEIIFELERELEGLRQRRDATTR